MIDRDRLDAAGRRLHGAWWHTPLAADLGVSRKSMHRWSTGESPVPTTVWPDLGRLLLAHARACEALANSLLESELQPPRKRRESA